MPLPKSSGRILVTMWRSTRPSSKSSGAEACWVFPPIFHFFHWASDFSSIFLFLFRINKKQTKGSGNGHSSDYLDDAFPILAMLTFSNKQLGRRYQGFHHVSWWSNLKRVRIFNKPWFFKKTVSLPSLPLDVRLIWVDFIWLFFLPWNNERKRNIIPKNTDRIVHQWKIGIDTLASGALVVGDDPLSVHSAYKTRTQGSYTSNQSRMTVFCDCFAPGKPLGN